MVKSNLKQIIKIDTTDKKNSAKHILGNTCSLHVNVHKSIHKLYKHFPKKWYLYSQLYLKFHSQP